MVKSFSRRECALWFLVPAICVSAFVPTLMVAQNWPTIVSSSGLINVADVFWRGFVTFGIIAGLWSVAFYLLTFWTGPLWRPILITAAIFFVVFGNIAASLANYHKEDRERGILLPELTKAEIAQRDREYQDALLLAGSAFAVIGGVGAGICVGIARSIRHRLASVPPTDKS